MKKLIIIPLLFLVGCITIKPECPRKTLPEEKIDWNKVQKTTDKGLFIDSAETGYRITLDTSFHLGHMFKDVITPEPIWDFNVIDSSYDAIDDSVIIYQFRYRVIPVEKEIYL